LRIPDPEADASCSRDNRLASFHCIPGRQRDDELLGARIDPHYRSYNIAFVDPEHLGDLDVG
jgi:hypothetical protein